ncbi:hypothetical protein NA57DRAFT_70740 [Rhizodiscina lignyota]|uniref:ABM domain-containing protein n=1 Tax=Rhizodiscina lignyota TaxID=1504668 RepID=A0A9P4IUI5_9PEZI|nr:hypothetical protein NA57DRAFT_70740 [Rhizodiscina lignyota]
MATKHPVPQLCIVARIFTKPEATKTVLGLHKTVAEYEFKQKECDSLCSMLPLEGDKSIYTIFETYDSMDYVTAVHRTSEPYKKWKEEEAKSDFYSNPVEIIKCNAKGGWVWRDEPSKLPLGEQFIWIATFKAHPGKRDDFMKVVLRHTDNVYRTEDETYSFLVLESAEDDVSVILFERYSSEAYFKNVHATSESMQEFRKNFQPLIAERLAVGFSAALGFVDKREGLA